jgi:CO/xanthine dehydrogenase FAD-binding subunit
VAISRITLAVMLRIERGRVGALRVAAGAVIPIGMRFPELEVHAAGMAADEATWIELSQELAESILKVTGLRWSSAYKLPVVAQALFGMLCELSEESRT